MKNADNINRLFAPLGLRLPEILLPARDFDKFAVIACDQHSAESEYWDETERIVGDCPSALRLMLPEAWLGRKNAGVEVPENMRRYLADGSLKSIGEGFVYVRRQTADGIRHGLLAAIDLEQYDFSPEADTLARATEATVRERLPARVALRREAVLEMPHVLVLTDDRENAVTALLEAALDRLPKLYDFELMQGGGHIEGYHVCDEALCGSLAAALNRLNDNRGSAPLYAVGDGNHSLAAARECWLEQRESIPVSEREAHPLRYALVELVSIYDEGLSFHPIHRLLCGVEPEQVQRELNFDAANPPSLQELQPRLDEWLSQHPEAELEYIHGAEECRRLGTAPDRLSIVFPHFERGDFFATIQRNGIFVRKSFSLGSANEKRYYLECRKIR